MKHSHYFKDVSALTHVDVYRVLALFGVTDPCVQHAIKKLLVSGERGAKDADQDIREAMDSLERYVAMREEEKVKATEPEWIVWAGGECPVPDARIVELKLRDGAIYTATEPRYCDWSIELAEEEDDIIAYRVLG